MKLRHNWWAALMVALFFLSPTATVWGEQQKDSATQAPTTTPEVKTEGDREKEAEELKRLQEFYLRNQSVFIKKGEYIVEFNTFYSTDKRQEFLPVAPGVFTLLDTRRRFFDAALFGRAGILTDGLELDVVFPFFVHADQESQLASGRSASSSTGIGDVGAALRYQVWYERGARPGLIIDITGKSRTGGDTLRGTGSANIGGGVTLIKSLDPVVFFGRLGYAETLTHGDRNPGNIIEYSAGMGFALNDRVAFNIQLAGAFIGKSKFQGQTIERSSFEIANIQFSSTILITKKLFVEPFVSIGLTSDAFDSSVGFRIPYRL
jgi:hypothetical protein